MSANIENQDIFINKIANKSRYLVFAVLLITSAVFASYAMSIYKNANGFCSAEGRYLTERELWERAFMIARSEYVSERKRKGALISEIHKERGYLALSDSEKYLEKNPGCCRMTLIESEGMKPTLWQRVAGYIYRYVSISRTIEVRDIDGNLGAAARFAFPISTCGKPRSFH
jgi:hypothetical protein